MSRTLLAGALLFGAGAADAAPATERRVVVGLLSGAERVSFSCEAPCALRDARGRRLDLAAGKTHEFHSAGSAVRFKDEVLAGSVRVETRGRGAVRLGSRRYPDCLSVKPGPRGALTVVCELGIEEYLLGVLPHEMSPSWPLEALKAQAVVARTFTYTQMGKFRDAGFHLSADTASQVYGGLELVSDPVRRAVAETRGEVLGYKGQILDVFYHACCGGHTTSPASVWGGSSPAPLRGVRDPYCEGSPHRRWTAYFRLEHIAAAAARSVASVGRLDRIELGEKDRNGWLRSVRVKVGGTAGEIRAAELRSALGHGELKSLRISKLRKTPKGVEFHGGGSGHGVGLCQWGAKLQADRGRGYERILAFYFPGSELSVVDE